MNPRDEQDYIAYVEYDYNKPTLKDASASVDPVSTFKFVAGKKAGKDETWFDKVEDKEIGWF